jgi:hypothetical protein
MNKNIEIKNIKDTQNTNIDISKKMEISRNRRIVDDYDYEENNSILPKIGISLVLISVIVGVIFIRMNN